MTSKSYTVFFAKISFPKEPSSIKLTDKLDALLKQHGNQFPIEKIESFVLQIRDLRKIGHVWLGAFGRLRDDALHIVGGDLKETTIELADDQRLLDKCYFMYYETTNVLVWQSVRSVSGLSKFEDYLRKIFGLKVLVHHILNKSKIEEILSGNIYEVIYSYENPVVINTAAPNWSQSTFDIMKELEAGHAKFAFRAFKDKNFSKNAKQRIGEMVGRPEFQRIKVRVRDDSNPIELFKAPYKANIDVDLIGGYPIEEKVFEELALAYDSVRANILNE